MPDAPALHGLLVTFRRPQALDMMLSRLHEQRRPLVDLLVIDNAADPECEAIVARWRAAGHLIDYRPAPQNLGPAGALAWGMDVLLRTSRDSDWLVCFDDDDPPKSSDILAELADFAERCRAEDPETAAVGTVGARFDWRRGRIRRVPDSELHGAVAVDYIGGNRFPFYSVAAVRTVGVPRADLFFGLDDLEYGLRLRRAGFTLFAQGERWLEQRRASGRIGRDDSPSTDLADLSWRRYYSQRNQIVILKQHRAWGAACRVSASLLAKPMLHAATAPKAAAGHLRLTGTAIRDGWTGRMGRTVEPPNSASRSQASGAERKEV